MVSPDAVIVGRLHLEGIFSRRDIHETDMLLVLGQYGPSI